MKSKILSFLVLVLLSTTLGANNNPVKEILLLNNLTVEVTIGTEAEKALFETAIFNKNGESLEFTTTSVVSYIQIFNENGVLEFQLPIKSKSISIGRSLFEGNRYRLGFIFEGKKEVQFTEVHFN